MSTTSDLAQEPGYFTKYKNFVLSRSAAGVLTLRFHTDGGPHTFDGTTHHDLPRLLEDIAFDKDNRILVLTGTGDSFIANIDGPSLGDITKPMGADVLYVEGRRARAPRRGPHHQHRLGDRDTHGCFGGCRPRGHEGRARRVHAGRGA